MQPKSWGLPSRGKLRSCVPQPSSLGCAPSLTKPSTDQVFTNSPGLLGMLGACVSRSAVWMTFAPARRRLTALGDVAALHAETAREVPPIRAGLGIVGFGARIAGDIEQRLLHEV